MIVLILSIPAYHQQVRPPSGQRRTGVKTPASYTPQQTVASTSFPFVSKPLGTRPKSHIGISSHESGQSLPERQTQSPKAQSPIPQPKLSHAVSQQLPRQLLSPVVQSSVSNAGADIKSLSNDMQRLSVEQGSNSTDQGWLTVHSGVSVPQNNGFNKPGVVKSGSSPALIQHLNPQGTSAINSVTNTGIQQDSTYDGSYHAQSQQATETHQGLYGNQEGNIV